MTTADIAVTLPVPPQVTTSRTPKPGPWREPDVAPRIGRAWREAAVPLLVGGEWVERTAIADAMSVVPTLTNEGEYRPILPSTCRSVVLRAWHHGVLERHEDRFRVTAFGRWCRPELVPQ